MGTVLAIVPKMHLADQDGKPLCLRKPRKFLPLTTDDLTEVTCKDCQRRFKEIETMTNTATETKDEPYVEPERTYDPESGFPYPQDPREALGWIVDLPFQDGTDSIRGEVLGASITMLEVAFEGECRRKCCLESVKFGDVTFVGLVPCECGSGAPEVLCLCDEVEAE